MAYHRRVVDGLLDEVLPDLAAIALEGAKGVGKTATGSQRAKAILSLNDPRQLEAVRADPDLATRLPPPVLIDEWQLEPAVWERVRRAADDDGRGGRFLLAGSAGVEPGVRLHSGAGRIVSLRMRPLALGERGIEEPSVSLASSLDEAGQAIDGRTDVALADYTAEIL